MLPADEQREIMFEQKNRQQKEETKQKEENYLREKEKEKERICTWGSDILMPSISLKLCTKKSLRSLNAFTMVETASPPAWPSPNAATAAF